VTNSADTLRRWFGLMFLALAFGMLIWGRTVLDDKLHGTSFLIYWSFCFLFTFLAIITALLDMRATRKKARAEQQMLLRRTLDDIDRDSRSEKE
jgi:uncharacterized metal-binding protein